jgi:hypothetical protein
MLTHPTLDQLRALKLDGMARAFVELEAQEEVRNLAHTEWPGAAARPRGRKPQYQALPDPIARRSAGYSQAAIEDVDYRRPVGSTRRCSSSWPPAAGSPTTAIFWLPVRAVSASRGILCTCAESPVRVTTIVTAPSDESRPPVPIDRDQCEGAVWCIC